MINILNRSIHKISRSFSSNYEMKSKVILYAKKFEGKVTPDHFKLVDEVLGDVKHGEFLVEALYLSVDPYTRSMALNSKPGTTMIGRQIAKVVETKNALYPKGSLIFGNIGWRTHTIVNPSNFENHHDLCPLPDLKGLSPSLALGVIGMPGNTAYNGFLDICKPKPGEIVVVTGAAGAVGSIVGQIAKIKGCKVIGFAGSDEKCAWLENELNFDKAINYKKGDPAKALKDAAPEGVDCFFDNVGGTLGSIIIDQMRMRGRISICGAISTYNDEKIMVPAQKTFHRRLLKMEGFQVYNFVDEWDKEGRDQMMKWVLEGKIKGQETITKGFENTPETFIGMMNGENTGKAIVEI